MALGNNIYFAPCIFSSVSIGADDDPHVTGSLSQLVLELSAVATSGEVLLFCPQTPPVSLEKKRKTENKFSSWLNLSMVVALP